MALTKYTYSKDANLTVLTDEILADAGITTALDHLDLIDDADPDTVDIWFVDAISGAEETALDAVVSAHGNPAVPTAFVCHTGAGAPDSYLGVDGDVCLDPNTMVLYKKVAGAWGAAKSIDGEFDDQYAAAQSDTGTTSGTYVDVDSMIVTTSNTQALNYLVSCQLNVSNSGNGNIGTFRLVADGVEMADSVQSIDLGSINDRHGIHLQGRVNLATAKVIKAQMLTDSSTLTVHERSISARGAA